MASPPSLRELSDMVGSKNAEIAKLQKKLAEHQEAEIARLQSQLEAHEEQSPLAQEQVRGLGGQRASTGGCGTPRVDGFGGSWTVGNAGTGELSPASPRDSPPRRAVGGGSPSHHVRGSPCGSRCFANLA